MELNETTPLVATASVSRSQQEGRNAHLIFDKIWTGCLALVLIVGFFTGLYLLLQEGNEEPITESFYLVPRRYWNAEPPSVDIPKLKLPVNRILLSQTNTTSCETCSDCEMQVLDIQKKHKGFLNRPDILYNFLVGGDGRVYEGRGWKNKTEWHNPDENILSIALLGNFGDQPPKPSQVEALLAFLDLSVMKNRITPCVSVLVDHTENRYFLDTAFQLEVFIRDQNKC
ncbi:unnamed protein product [Callosobruchus maculatus]|uniref:Peptidoglycan recognition protein family domain-containing protein n=1 Tax=Callosobruchus maculatus TaxID=64391 RepID=A0A653DRU2_CALMS|nr:unnamed protein product [Callosobruchus maculatus]